MKQKAPDCILLAQVGAFLLVMDNDAKALLQLTGLKLQMVGEIGDPVVLGGFPKSGFNANVGAKAESSSTSVARNCRKRRSVFSFIKNGFAIPKGCDYYCITACNNSNPPAMSG